MGNLLTHRNQTDQQQQLLDQIKQLSERVSILDKNADGVISKDEFKLWQSEQSFLIDKMTFQIMQQKDREYTEQITLLKKELEATKKINQGLEKAIRTHQDLKSVESNIKANPTTVNSSNSAESQGNNEKEKENKNQNMNQLFGEVSKLRIQEAVDRMISNENINIGYLPDIVERQMYKNVFNILLNMLNEVSDGVSIKVLGHEITMEMNAIDEQK